jgi:hypothetical protein
MIMNSRVIFTIAVTSRRPILEVFFSFFSEARHKMFEIKVKKKI